MAEDDKADGLDLKGMRDDTIKTMIGMLKGASSIKSKEPSSNLLKKQIKEIVATYEKDFKPDSPETTKNYLYNVIQTSLKNTNNMVDKVENLNNQPIKNIVYQAKLAFQESTKFNFEDGADKHLEKIDNIIKTQQISKSQSEVKEAKPVKKNIKNQLGSAISKIETIKDEIVKDLKDNKKFLKVFNDTISPILSEMYKFQDKINEQKENLVKKKEAITFSGETREKVANSVEEKIKEGGKQIEEAGKKLMSGLKNLPSNLKKLQENISKDLQDKIEPQFRKLQTRLESFEKKTIPNAIEKTKDTIDTVIDKVYNKIPDTLTNAQFNAEQAVRNKKKQVEKNLIILRNLKDNKSITLDRNIISTIIREVKNERRKANNRESSTQGKNPTQGRTSL